MLKSSTSFFNNLATEKNYAWKGHFLVRMEFVKENSILFTDRFNEYEIKTKELKIFFVISSYNLKKRKQLCGRLIQTLLRA